MVIGKRAHRYEVNAMLKVTKPCEDRISEFFLQRTGVKRRRLQRNFHLTVYHGRRRLPGLIEHGRPIRIVVETVETRFMVLAPGGENPRSNIDPRALSIGIRLTKRNSAIKSIQKLRENVFKYETPRVIGERSPTTAWRNCFGSRNYQPHIQLLKPWNKIDFELAEIGEMFRSEIPEIEFGWYEIESRRRINDTWEVLRQRASNGDWI